MINSFKDLVIYQLSLDVAVEIYKLVKKLPPEEKYEFGSQLRRASSSIGANIAEGFGRYHYKDKIKFYYNARGSLLEVEHFITLGNKLNYFSTQDLDRSLLMIKNLGIKLNNFIGVSLKNLEQ